MDDEASDYGKRIRDNLVNASGRPLNAYLNYAHGDECQQALYVYEPWRLEMLGELKTKYDPNGRLSRYNPTG